VAVSDATRSRSRLSRAARREQLLDAAAELLVEMGEGAVTMERVAEWAGVSKALPYSHFENSDDVLVALYSRVVGQLGERILAAIESSDPSTDRAPLLVATYFDAVADIGPILGAVTASGSRTAELADGDHKVGPRFVARLLTDHFGIPREPARAAAPILLASLTGAVLAWRDRASSRAELERMVVAVMRALVAAANEPVS
jgi:AcrR family transcriptional regulator